MLTITISNQQVEQRLADASKASGVTLDELAQDILLRGLESAPTLAVSSVSDEAFAALLESMAIPGSTPIPQDANIRELAYGE